MNEENKTGKEFSEKLKELIEKGKDLADKAEAKLEETINKAKASEEFEKVSELVDKGKAFMENQSDEYNYEKLGAKVESFKAEAEKQADGIIDKIKDAGLKFCDKVDESIDKIKGKKNQEPKA